MRDRDGGGGVDRSGPRNLVRQRTIGTVGRIEDLQDGALDALINGLNRAVGRADVQTGAVEADSALS